MDLGTLIFGNLRQCFLETVGVGGDELRMVIEDARLVDPRRSGADLGPGVLDVLAILAATGIGTVRRQNDGQSLPNAILGHRAKRIGQHGMPVAIAPVDRQADAVALQLWLECSEQACAPGR